jgi:hypothetical protein
MTEPQEGPVSSRFVGIMSLITSCVFGVLAMSPSFMIIMLTATAVVPLVRPYRTHSRWRIGTAYVSTGVLGTVAIHFMRSRGVSFP